MHIYFKEETTESIFGRNILLFKLKPVGLYFWNFLLSFQKLKAVSRDSSEVKNDFKSTSKKLRVGGGKGGIIPPKALVIFHVAPGLSLSAKKIDIKQVLFACEC